MNNVKITITPPNIICIPGVSSIINHTQTGPKIVSSNINKLIFATCVSLVANVRAANEKGNMMNPVIEIANKFPEKKLVFSTNKIPIKPTNKPPKPVAPVAGISGLDLKKTKFNPKAAAVNRPQNKPVRKFSCGALTTF